MSMTFTSSDCNNDLELALFFIQILFGLLLIVSITMVFSNESENEKPAWKYFAFIWLWPLRPFWTANGLNKLARKWRPLYTTSLSVTLIVTATMYFLGFCQV